jgi:hypothetical protein
LVKSTERDVSKTWTNFRFKKKWRKLGTALPECTLPPGGWRLRGGERSASSGLRGEPAPDQGGRTDGKGGGTDVNSETSPRSTGMPHGPVRLGHLLFLASAR